MQAELSDKIAERLAISKNNVSSPVAAYLMTLQIVGEEYLKSNWHLRRGLGRFAGRILRDANADDKKAKHEFLELFTFWMQTGNGTLTAAHSLADLSTAQIIGETRLVQLLTVQNPQVSWQLAKELSIIWRCLPFTALTVMRDKSESNRWLRRRILLSLFMQPALLATKAGRNLWNDLLILEALHQGHVFLTALEVWVRWHFAIGLDLSPLGHEAPNIVDAADHFINGPIGRTLINTSSLQAALSTANAVCSPETARLWDIFAIELDHQIQTHCLEVFAEREGRYGHIRSGILRWIQEGISEVPKINRLMELVQAEDEGVRWAVAAILPVITQNSNESLTSNLLIRLLDDDHPWVLRESLHTYASLWHTVEEDVRITAIKRARNRCQTAKNDGWSASELDEAFTFALSCDPIQREGLEGESVQKSSQP
jgi:hypothetical protein